MTDWDSKFDQEMAQFGDTFKSKITQQDT